MRDGVSLNDQNKMKPVVTPTDLMSLNNREAYLKLPGNLPIAKVQFAIPTSKLICPAFIPITGYKPPETGVFEVPQVPEPQTGVPKETVPSVSEREQQVAAENSGKQDKAQNPRVEDLKSNKTKERQEKGRQGKGKQENEVGLSKSPP